jgi:hypothetical protein
VGQLLHGLGCGGCNKLPSELTKKDMDREGVLIRYCDISNKNDDPTFCDWHCTPCYNKEVAKENDALDKLNGGGGSRKRTRRG